MSGMMYVIQDAQRVIHSSGPQELAETLVAGLSDDPVNIAELATALKRFRGSPVEKLPLSAWSTNDPPKLPRSGVMWIDLRSADVLYEASGRQLEAHGQLELRDPNTGKRKRYPYGLSHRWSIVPTCREWLAENRQGHEAAVSPNNHRTVLYDKVARFLIQQCLDARGGDVRDDGTWRPPEQWQWRELPGRGKRARRITVDDGVAEIHARWLMTPIPELGGRTPRQVLTADRDEVAHQVQMREMEWSANREPPEPLAMDSFAYQYGAIGPHEGFVYYDLVRFLTQQCWTLVVQRRRIRARKDKQRIEQVLIRLRDRWLTTPNHDHDAMRPIDIIESERRRLPLSSDGHDHLDDDCPLCQLAAEIGVGFWHLDGSHMDPEYPFSLDDLTYAAWEEQQAEWESYCEQLDRRHIESFSCHNPDSDEFDGEKNDIWEFSAAHGDAFEMPFTALFVIGAHVAEIGEVLRGLDPNSEWPEQLNRQFGNLRDALQGDANALLLPVAESFADILHEVGNRHTLLTARCRALTDEIQECAERFRVQS